MVPRGELLMVVVELEMAERSREAAFVSDSEPTVHHRHFLIANFDMLNGPADLVRCANLFQIAVQVKGNH